MQVGVIGAGSMGQNHARLYAALAELVGICDTDPAMGKPVAERFGTSYFPSHDALLDAGVEAVSIATPTDQHFDVARDTLERGVHALVEKPMGGAVEPAERLAQLADDQGVVLAAGMVERHNPAVEFAREALQRGTYGKLIAASARRVSSFPTRVRDIGVMMDLGIHDVDVLRFLVGEPVERVYGVAGREQHEEFEDHAVALLTFEGGVTGMVEANWLTPMKVRRVALTASENFIEVDYINQTLDISSSSLPTYDPSDLYQAPFEYETHQVSLKKEEPLRRELRDFLQAVEEGRKPLVDGWEAVETLRVVEAITESQRRGVPVEVS